MRVKERCIGACGFLLWCGDDSHPESNKFRNTKGSRAQVSPGVPEVGRGRRGGEAVLLFLGDAWLHPEPVVG